jgi:uncharacterized membrane protein YccC
MTLPGGRDWLFSIKTFAAAMSAVYIGFAASLPRPYWAMATVYICSHPLSGATRSKAVFRILGTLLGATAAVVFVPNLVNAPVLLVGALTLWVAGCLYLSLLDRSPRSYTFMLAGYTAALIGFPTVLDPASIFDTAVSRVEEISLGIICASVVAGVVFPSSVGAAVAERANQWLANAARLSLDILGGRRDDPRTRAELIRLAGDAADLDMLASHLAYDTSNLRDVRRHIEAMRVRMLMLLPVLSSIADRLAALGAPRELLPPTVAAAVEALRDWIDPGPVKLDPLARRQDAERVEHLRAVIAGAAPPLDAHAGWTDIMAASLLLRLRELLDLASDTRVLRRAVATHRAALSAPLAFQPEAGIKPQRHRDHAMALLSALGVALTISLCSAFWIETGWPDGASAPMLAAVACCFFASRDDPVPAILQFANWTAVSVVLMSVYQFALFPMAHDFEILVLLLAPTFLVFGVLIAMPATMGIGLALAANGSTIIALQGSFNADFAAYVNGNVALMLGMYVSAITMRIVRSVGAEWATWRLIGAGRSTLARAALGHGRQDRGRFAGLMLDRIGLIAPRLAALEPDSAVRGVDVLAGLRIGLNIVDLRRARRALPDDVAARIDDVLQALGKHYRGERRPADPGLLARIDEALATLPGAPEGAGKGDALLGLVGIRRGLFPDAPPYRAEEPTDPLPGLVAA